MYFQAYEGATQRFGGVLLPGYLLDWRYEIQRQIAESGMCNIYEARDRMNGGDRVVIKQLKSQSDPDCPTRAQSLILLRREAFFLAQSSSVYLPHLYAVALNSFDPYLVLEYIDGISLEQRLQWVGPSLEEALLICDRICAAVADLHTQRPVLIHGDLTLRNIMLVGHDRIMLIDLGLSRRIGEPAPLAIAVGTEDFMSLEQRANQPLNESSDVYALGEVFRRVLGATATPQLLHVVKRASSDTATARYTNVAQLRQALRSASQQQISRSSYQPQRGIVQQWLVLLIVFFWLLLLMMNWEVLGQAPHRPLEWEQLSPVPAPTNTRQR